MSVRFNRFGQHIPVTLIEAGPCLITAKKTQDKNGYLAAVLQFQKNRKLTVSKEVRIDNLEDFEVGQQISVTNFAAGDIVKITGTSKGRGFAGVVKRWGFAGGPKTHGQSDRHRAPGSIGAGTTPGRVYKGKKMAGRLGGNQVTVANLQIVEIDKNNNLLVVKGAVPGHFKSIVFIKKTGQAKTAFSSTDKSDIQSDQAIDTIGKEQIKKPEN